MTNRILLAIISLVFFGFAIKVLNKSLKTPPILDVSDLKPACYGEYLPSKHSR